MKNIVIAFLATLICQTSFACSELGKVEFKISEKKLKVCQEMAYEIALALTQISYKHSPKHSPSRPQFLKPPFTGSKSPAIYQSTKSSKTMGFSTSIESSSNWSCLYCVDLYVDEKENCGLSKIAIHHCG